MTTPNTPPPFRRQDSPDDGPSISGNVLVVTLAGMFIAVIAGCVMLGLGLEESRNPAGLIALLLGAFATLVTSIGTLVAVSNVRANQDKMTRQVGHLANGGGDAKIQAAVRRVLDERDPDNPAQPPAA